MSKNQSIFFLFFVITSGSVLNMMGVSSNTVLSFPNSAQSPQSQQLIDYFLEFFEDDWTLGEDYEYNSSLDMVQQSYERTGSGYTPFKSDHIKQNMSITPIFSPDNSESLLLSLIDNASTKLYIEQMYIYNETSTIDILQAIINAHGRGVDVKVIVGEDNDESGETADNLTNYGIPVRVSVEDAGNGNYFDTMHNKGIISDDQVLISSINWSPTSIFYNRESGLIVESSLVADYFEMLFDYDWIASEVYNSSVHFESYLVPPKPSNGGPLTSSPEYTPKFATPRTFTGEFEIDALASPDNCFEIVEEAILNAQKSIFISVYTLSSPYLLEALRNRVAAGLDVRLLLEQNQFSSYEKKYNRHTMYNLTTLGVAGNYAHGRWAAANNEFTFQHCKYAIIDNKTLIVSSGNWSRASCPKPQDDGDVNGNRDWWIIINSEKSTPTPLNLKEIILFYILPGIIVAGLAGIIFLITKNRKAFSSVV